MEEGKEVKESVGREEEIKRNILAFCKAHDFHVHPAKNLDDHIKSVIEIGACPCDSRRKECPCPQATDEIELGRGSCACTILVSNAYLEEWHYAGTMPLYLRKKRRPVTLFRGK